MKVRIIKKKETLSVINNLKISDTLKVKLTIAINFISSKDNGEEGVMYSKGDHIKIIINDTKIKRSVLFIRKNFKIHL